MGISESDDWPAAADAGNRSMERCLPRETPRTVLHSLRVSRLHARVDSACHPARNGGLMSSDRARPRRMPSRPVRLGFVASPRLVGIFASPPRSGTRGGGAQRSAPFHQFRALPHPAFAARLQLWNRRRTRCPPHRQAGARTPSAAEHDQHTGSRRARSQRPVGVPHSAQGGPGTDRRTAWRLAGCGGSPSRRWAGRS